MKPTTTVIRPHRSLVTWLSLSVLSIALALLCIDQNPSHAATQLEVTPIVLSLPGTLTPVNNGPGNQTNPRVYRDRVTYTNTDSDALSLIHLFDFSTGTDSVVPGNGLDRLADVADTHVAFTEITPVSDEIVLYDTATACDSLMSFINECSAQSGKKLTEDQTNQLINAATQIRTELDCQ